MSKSDPTAGLDNWLENRCGVNDKPFGDCAHCENEDCVDQWGRCVICGWEYEPDPDILQEVR